MQRRHCIVLQVPPYICTVTGIRQADHGENGEEIALLAYRNHPGMCVHGNLISHQLYKVSLAQHVFYYPAPLGVGKCIESPNRRNQHGSQPHRNVTDCEFQAFCLLRTVSLPSRVLDFKLIDSLTLYLVTVIVQDNYSMYLRQSCE